MPQPILKVLLNHRSMSAWHSAIGYAIVNFGTLERLMLEWASHLSEDKKMLKSHHKSDMKAIAPLLSRVLKAKKHKVPSAKLDLVLRLVDAATKLIDDRNDIAHGWLSNLEGHLMGNDDQATVVWLYVPKTDKRPVRVYGLRDLEWTKDVGHRISQVTRHMSEALEDLAQVWPHANTDSVSYRQ